ncbi:MAG: hypothetical protein ACWGPR_09530 [Candidatus Deferrimicrobiaceae bacterium]
MTPLKGFLASLRPGETILIGVVCTYVGAMLYLFSDTLFGDGTIVYYVLGIGASLFLVGLMLIVSGVIQALIGVIKTLILTIRGWIIDDDTG